MRRSQNIRKRSVSSVNTLTPTTDFFRTIRGLYGDHFRSLVAEPAALD
jgi:hypothetical protein